RGDRAAEEAHAVRRRGDHEDHGPLLGQRLGHGGLVEFGVGDGRGGRGPGVDGLRRRPGGGDCEVLGRDRGVARGGDGVLRLHLEGGADLLGPAEVERGRHAPVAGLVEGEVGGVDAPFGGGEVDGLRGVGGRGRGAGQREVGGGGGRAGLGGAGGRVRAEEGEAERHGSGT